MIQYFIMTCGLPASGKTSIVQEYVKGLGYVYLSSDELREELFGNVNDQMHNGKVFEEMNRRAVAALKAGGSVVYDACNASYKRRMALLKQIKKYNPITRCIVTYKPYVDCLKDDSERERQAGEEAIRRTLLSFYFPQYFEGWHEIWVLNYKNPSFPLKDENCISSLFFGENGLCGISHFNHHHSLSVGDHILATYLNCKEFFAKHAEEYFPYIERQVCAAALYHDIGKPFVQGFTDSKGEVSKEAHYYQHHLVSAYQAYPYLKLDKNLDESDMLEILGIIDFHMHPFFWEKDNNVKMQSRYEKLLGNNSRTTSLYEKVMILHKADLAAH